MPYLSATSRVFSKSRLIREITFTIPAVLTVAIAVLLDDQVTFLLVAFEGATVAVNVVVAPATTLAVVGETVTPVTATLVPEVPLTTNSHNE